MAEEKSRILRVLEALSQCVDPAKPADIGSMIEETPFNTGHDLFELEKSGMADKPDKGKSLYKITARGRETLENPPDKWVYKSRRETPPHTPPPGTPPGAPSGVPLGALPEEIIIPSQSDLLRSIGENLGVGSRKGDIRLDTITFYVQQTANLDNPTSVWNALTEMGVANDVKKRWIKLYIQNLPGRQVPEELREKLEGGLEPDKVKAEDVGIPPKPKRFSVIGGEIMGDPEGDYNFREALQYVAQQREASPDKEKEGGSILEIIQTLKELGLIGKTGEGEPSSLDQLAKLADLGLLKKPGEGEGSETVRALQIEVKELKESLQKQEMDTLKSVVVSISNQVTELRKDMSNQGKLEGRYALMDKTIGAIDGQLSGLRSDVRPVLDTLARRGGGPGPSQRSPEEKARMAKELKKAVGKEQEAHALEDELLFGIKPQPEEPAEVTAEPAPAPQKLLYE